jgi:hypothetical protein
MNPKYMAKNSTDKTNIAEIDILKSQLMELKKSVEDKTAEQRAIISLVTYTLLRISSVALAVFLIQILVNFTRYNFRVSDHLDATADAILLTNGDFSANDKIAELFTTRHIEFGKMPMAPTEQAMIMLKELIHKLPSK